MGTPHGAPGTGEEFKVHQTKVFDKNAL